MYYAKRDGLGFDPITTVLALTPLKIAADIWGSSQAAKAAKAEQKATAKLTAAQERMQTAALAAQAKKDAETRAMVIKLATGGALVVAGVVALIVISKRRK